MSGATHYDTIVIGAGTWGSATAWRLGERGQRVLALDKARPPYDRASHSGETRLGRSSNSSGPEYVELSRVGIELWNELGRRSGRKVIEAPGSVFIGQPGSDWFDATLHSLQEGPFEYDVLTDAEARARFPRLRIADGEQAVWEPAGSVIYVKAAIEALQQVATEAGAEFRFDEPVTAWREDDDGVVVSTSAGQYTADRLVVTAGAFSSRVLGLDLPVNVVRHVLANFAVDPAAEPLPAMYFAAPPGDDSAPAYGCMDPSGQFKFHAISHNDVIDPDELSLDVTARDTERTVGVAQDRIPEITSGPVATTVCMWTEAVDGHWLLGRLPSSERVVIGAGCNGRGFRYAPAVAEALADLLEGRARPDLARFDPARFDLPARGASAGASSPDREASRG